MKRLIACFFCSERLCCVLGVPLPRPAAIVEENQRFDAEIFTIKARLNEIPHLQAEIEELRKKVVEARKKGKISP